MLTPDLVRAVSAVSSFLGLISLLALFHFRLQERAAQRSIRDVLGDERERGRAGDLRAESSADGGGPDEQ